MMWFTLRTVRRSALARPGPPEGGTPNGKKRPFRESRFLFVYFEYFVVKEIAQAADFQRLA